jgi:hypothetical protein
MIQGTTPSPGSVCSGLRLSDSAYDFHAISLQIGTGRKRRSWHGRWEMRQATALADRSCIVCRTNGDKSQLTAGRSSHCLPDVVACLRYFSRLKYTMGAIQRVEMWTERCTAVITTIYLAASANRQRSRATLLLTNMAATVNGLKFVKKRTTSWCIFQVDDARWTPDASRRQRRYSELT